MPSLETRVAALEAANSPKGSCLQCEMGELNRHVDGAPTKQRLPCSHRPTALARELVELDSHVAQADAETR